MNKSMLSMLNMLSLISPFNRELPLEGQTTNYKTRQGVDRVKIGTHHFLHIALYLLDLGIRTWAYQQTLMRRRSSVLLITESRRMSWPRRLLRNQEYEHLPRVRRIYRFKVREDGGQETEETGNTLVTAWPHRKKYG